MSTMCERPEYSDKTCLFLICASGRIKAVRDQSSDCFACHGDSWRLKGTRPSILQHAMHGHAAIALS
jgi:hypothetical protein